MTGSTRRGFAVLQVLQKGRNVSSEADNALGHTKAHCVPEVD
jgi:hypothetical protein